ncbi:unnamed protein product [Hermetia illucens]|uniref:Uncharacterized protein n=1 Tax=Hermetia illucens TaxID=343691 RepID=A0A7R8UD68_HERIL|nr:unnamed protein product [Hermetia illucens]
MKVEGVQYRTISGIQQVEFETITKTPPEIGIRELTKWRLADLSNRTFDAIIGANILNPTGAVIDYNSKTVKFGNNTIPFLTNEEVEIKYEDVNLMEPVEKVEIKSKHLNSEEKTPDKAINFLKIRLQPGTVAIYSEVDGHEYNKLQQIILEGFGNTVTKFSKVTQIVKEMTNEEDLIDRIKYYHEKETAHAGLKNQIYYPNLHKYIHRYINACQVYNETIQEKMRLIPVRKNMKTTSECFYEALEFYNRQVYTTTQERSIDVEQGRVDKQKVHNKILTNKERTIKKTNLDREKFEELRSQVFIKNPKAERNKLAPKFKKAKYNSNIAKVNIKRPKKDIIIPGQHKNGTNDPATNKPTILDANGGHSNG